MSARKNITVCRDYKPAPDACADALVTLLKSSVKNKAAEPTPSPTAVTEPRFKEIPPMPFYPTNHNPRDSQDTLPMLRDLYSKHPEARYLEPYELQSFLWSLGYTDELLGEAEIAAAIEVARTDHDPNQGAA